jgi:hypothetical protein
MGKEKEWWQEGLNRDAIDNAEKQAANRSTGRFFMKPNTKREIVFIDDTGVSYWEHQYEANGTFYNYTPCLEKNKAGSESLGKRCPLCRAKNYAYFVGQFSIIDLDNKWTDKKGKEHVNEVKLYAAKTDVLKKLLRRKEKKVSLVGIKFEVARGGKKDFLTGSDFDIVEEGIDIAKLYPEAKPIDYQATVLQLISVEEMQAIVDAGGAARSKADDASAADDEDIPY